MKDPKLLPGALVLSLRYQDEFMDDHAPLVGDPGSFLQGQGGAGRGGGGQGRGAGEVGKKVQGVVRKKVG